MNNTIKVTLGVLAGAVSGIVAGYLFAPDKGSKTRKRLKKDAMKLQNEMEDMASEKLLEAKKILNDGTKRLSKSAHQSIDKVKKNITVA